MKAMVIRSLTVFVAVAMAVVGLFSAAQAQDSYDPYNPTTPTVPSVDPVAPQLGYDGPYGNPAPESSGAFGFGSSNPVAAAAEATGDGAVGGTGGGTGGLAVTGASEALPVAIAMGLLASGGTAVVAARKRED